MASVSASDFQNVMNITTSATDLEYVLDLSIDMLNIYGTSLSNMTGEAGSKTVTLTSKQRGGVFLVAREIYKKFYKDTDSASVSGLAITTTDILNDSELASLCEQIGAKLAATSEGIPFGVAEDDSGIS